MIARLAEREAWTRGDFDSLAKEFGVMPDGAIETINEWALDSHGEPLIDDGSHLAINRALLSATLRSTAISHTPS
jgi:hypothetical protein